MARMSGRYMLRVSVDGSSPKARSRITRRSLGTESRSLPVSTNHIIGLRSGDPNLSEGRHAELEAIAESDVDVAHLGLVSYSHGVFLNVRPPQ